MNYQKNKENCVVHGHKEQRGDQTDGQSKMPNHLGGDLYKFIDCVGEKRPACFAHINSRKKLQNLLGPLCVQKRVQRESKSVIAASNSFGRVDQIRKTESTKELSMHTSNAHLNHLDIQRECKTVVAASGGFDRVNQMSKTEPIKERPRTNISANKTNTGANKVEIETLIGQIKGVDGVDKISGVYDTCPEVMNKINDFLVRDGVSRTALLKACNIPSPALTRFLQGKGQDQNCNITYQRAYLFFEKLRILHDDPKTASRIKHEAEHPNGYTFMSWSIPTTPRNLC